MRRSNTSQSWLEECSSPEQQEFFRSSFVRPKTTFTSAAKSADRLIPDDGMSFAMDAADWTLRRGKEGKMVARPRIVGNLGALARVPGPGAYDADDQLRSKIERAPAFSMTSKHEIKSFGDVYTPGPGTYKLGSHVDRFAEKSSGKIVKSSTDGGLKTCKFLLLLYL